MTIQNGNPTDEAAQSAGENTSASFYGRQVSPARIAARLLRTQGRGALSTILARKGSEGEMADSWDPPPIVVPAPSKVPEFGSGWPFTSLVTVALRSDSFDGFPLLLLSGLSEHTRNLLADSRLSLLLEDVGGFEDPLAGPRLTLVGRAVMSTDAENMRRFVERHPKAALYAGFSDFAIWEVRWQRAHLIAGFGRAGWLDRAEIMAA